MGETKANQNLKKRRWDKSVNMYIYVYIYKKKWRGDQLDRLKAMDRIWSAGTDFYFVSNDFSKFFSFRFFSYWN
jgi:hypothetical protein